MRQPPCPGQSSRVPRAHQAAGRAVLGFLSTVTTAVSATRGSRPSRRRQQRPPQSPRGPEALRNLGSGGTPAAAPAGSVRPAEAAPWQAHPRTRAAAARDWLSPASFPQPASVARTSLYTLPEPETARLRGPLSPPPSAQNEIIQQPPGGWLSTRLRGHWARILSCSAAAATAEATTRHQPSHSAAMFARSMARAASAGPARLRDPAGMRAELGSLAVSGRVFLHRPHRSAARHWPWRAAPAPPPPRAPGARCAGAQEPSPTPPRPRLTRLLPLRFFPFCALHHLLPFLASFQTPPQAS